MRRRMLVTALVHVVALLAVNVSLTRAHDALVCIPPVAQTEAECIFDVWGYVYDIDGKPFLGIGVSDGGQSDISDARGFYAIHELGFGSYQLTASKHGCSSDVKTVQITVFTTLEENGHRQDFHMPCRISD